MFKFALKNMAIKKVQIILVLISIVLSAGIGVLAYNVANQVNDGIVGNAQYYSVIIGPAGSSTQLVMNSMYFTDEPVGTIPYRVVQDLQRDSRIQNTSNIASSVIPFAMADNYNGYKVVGTNSYFLSEKVLSDGEMFDDNGSLEVVVGCNVASANKLKVGDKIKTSHSVGEEHDVSLTVVGILKRSNSVFDNTVFTELRTIWDVHEHAHEEGEEEEEHDHEEIDGMVCAVLVKTKTPADATMIATEYTSGNKKVLTILNEGHDHDHDHDLDESEDHDEHENHDESEEPSHGSHESEESDSSVSYTLQGVEPMAVVRDVLNETNNTKYIVFVLCAVILIMNVMIISIITLLNMYHSAKEISLMRLIGISMKKVNLLYIIQNGLIGIVSTVLAFFVSRFCLTFMGDYVASMGVVLSTWKVYPLEIVILAGIFLISVIPTFICTLVMSHKDGISD